MEYAVLIYVDENQSDPSMTEDYTVYTQQLIDAGVMAGGRKLERSSSATTVRVRDDEQLITDGPFAEAREQLGGFYLFECQNLDEALKWASLCPGAKYGTIEVRPVAPS
ncbi:MAG TPA: YciI family protein [Amycolatopsis sp.]|nr:YciI family protein [Amycolatopsis sp.]